MSKITLAPNASGTGTLTVAAPNTNSDYTLTLPAETGTVLTSGGAIDVNASAPADSVVIDSSGGMHIGTTSTYGTNSKLSILGTVTAADTGIVLSDGATTTIGLALATPATGSVPYIFGNNNLAFGSNGAERMRIDSAGRITMPYQPMFAAKKNINQNLSGGATADISFNSAIVNIGSHYNTTTSKFTAPIAGTYFFSFQTAVAFNSAAYFSLVPLKNGSALGNYAAFNNSNGGTGYQSTATSFIITLAANDYINCELQQGDNATIDNAGMFCGYLIG